MVKKKLDMLAREGMTRRLIMFALPIMASGVVQQSFNAVDVAVVGRFVGNEAVAAVGANSPVIGLIINLFVGIAIGSNVVIATFLGQRDDRGVARAVATSFLLSLISGVFLLILGLSIADPVLRALGTPENVHDRAVLYMRIFSLGLPAMMVYNFVSAILRSVGDTKRPFYWLMAGGIVNVILNLIFVIVLGMGVEGVAIATVVSNYVGAIGVTGVLMREHGALQLKLQALRLHRGELGKILRIGVPAGIQGMVFALGNAFVQSGINSFGHEAMAGSAAALNFEFYCYFLISSFAQAATAFVSQNYGAGQRDNCRRIFRRCLWLSFSLCLACNIVFAIYSHELLHLFLDSESAIAYGAERMTYVLLLQFIASTYEIAGASMRALGYSMTPTVLTIIGTCLLRVVWVSAGTFDELKDLLIIYPITWTATGVSVTFAYFRIARKKLHTAPTAR